MYRTAHCGKLTEAQVGETVTLSGWVQKRRDLGGLIFIDLRDRSGIVQIVFSPEVSEEALREAEAMRSEYVIRITGVISKRDNKAINDKMATGRIELNVQSAEIINASKTPPFEIKNEAEVSEEIRLKYRYLDLRRPEMQDIFKMRHQVTKHIRDYLDNEAFLEIETPMLTKSTPEGARDYLVPSRVHAGQFYALPQSPQLFKQLLMVSGMEKYYQVVRCFRDEDLRADRQPEFTQIDVEMSFFEKEPFMAMVEKMLTSLVAKVKGKEVQMPFARMTYKEAMARYGSDKPDTRFGMELLEVTGTVKDSDFKVFKDTAQNGGIINALNVEGAAGQYSRKNIDELADFTALYGAKGLAWLKVENGAIKGPIAKFFDEMASSELLESCGAKDGDLLLFVADKAEVVKDSLGALRVKLGKDLQLIDESKLNFLWVTEFPLLGYDVNENRYVAEHHPFTMPLQEDLDKLTSDPGAVRAEAYDIVLNGYELGGGSLRIHQRHIQEQMFKALGFSQEEAKAQFGFLLEAFEYGTPPHGGIALGLDRLVMILAGRTNLRDTIAFPKTASATCLLTQAPGSVSERQLEDLHLSIKTKSKSN